MHISVFFLVDKYSAVIILCNYLQINNDITLFLKKNILKYLCENCIENFDTSKFSNNITDRSEKVI